MKKRLLSLLLALVTALSLCAPALAADADYATEVADALHAAGLFSGTGTRSDGTPIYDLDSTATRAQAVTMLVRVLGKEAEAQTGTYTTPFTDVPDWAKGYVGYAYTARLTNGVAADAFGSQMTVSAVQYLTFVLIALGYESGTDFMWNTSYTLAEELGIIDAGEWRANETFTRGDMVVISYKALLTAKKGGSKTLAKTLGLTDLAVVEAPAPDPTLNGPQYPGSPTTFHYVNAEDPALLVMDNLGNMVYDIGGAAEGTVIRHSDLELIGSANENVTNFFTAMNQIDSAIEVNSDGKITYNGHNGGVYKVQNSNYVLTMSSWGGWSAGTTVGRNIFLNGLVYFGGEEMGTAVWGLLDEHYRFRSDGSVPISNELAAKYGLTIKNQETKNNLVYTATVSNGMDTWVVSYCTENPYGFQTTGVNIPV